MAEESVLSAFLLLVKNITNTEVSPAVSDDSIAANVRYAGRVTGLYPSNLFLAAKSDQVLERVARSIPFLYSTEGLDNLYRDLDKLLNSFKGPYLLEETLTVVDLLILAIAKVHKTDDKQLKKFNKLKKYLDTVKKQENIKKSLLVQVPVEKFKLPRNHDVVKEGSGRRLRVQYVLKDSSLVGQVVTVKGWAKTVRIQGNGTFAFVEVNDGSCVSNLQVIVSKVMPDFDRLSGTGISVVCKGLIVKSPGQKQSVEMKVDDLANHEFRVMGECDNGTYPLSKKDHTVEFLRSIGHLRPRTRLISAIARVRNALAYATHSFFQGRGFVYVHTPIVTASDCEGAGEMFQVSTSIPNKVADIPHKDGVVDWSKDFFGKPAFLTVSGQLAVENYACALSDVYTFGPTFRAEMSYTSRHLAEFWMIEPELAWAELEDNMECAESYLKHCIKYVLDNCPEDIEFFDATVENGLIERLKVVLHNKFARVTYTEAVDIIHKSGKEFKENPQWGDDLKAEHERYICEEVIQGPVIVYNYPKVLKAFYMKVNEDNQTVQAMDILVPFIGEIIGGSVREDRLDRLDDMLQFKNLDKEVYWWYRDLRKYGSVPHAGFGLGFERMVMMVTGVDNIRETIPYPRWPGHAEF
jgi:asparaginyl-tRNA synthetase